MSKRGRGILRGSCPYFCLYSPECVEVEFPEVRAALANKIVPLTGAVSFGRR
jgi:hypothetical protein